MVLAGVQVRVESDHTAQHQLSICLLAPGLYSMYVYNVQQGMGEGGFHSTTETLHKSCEGVLAIKPLYVLAE